MGRLAAAVRAGRARIAGHARRAAATTGAHILPSKADLIETAAVARRLARPRDQRRSVRGTLAAVRRVNTDDTGRTAGGDEPTENQTPLDVVHTGSSFQ